MLKKITSLPQGKKKKAKQNNRATAQWPLTSKNVGTSTVEPGNQLGSCYFSPCKK